MPAPPERCDKRLTCLNRGATIQLQFHFRNKISNDFVYLSFVPEGKGSESLERHSHRKRSQTTTSGTSWSHNPSTQTSPTRHAIGNHIPVRHSSAITNICNHWSHILRNSTATTTILVAQQSTPRRSANGPVPFSRFRPRLAS